MLFLWWYFCRICLSIQHIVASFQQNQGPLSSDHYLHVRDIDTRIALELVYSTVQTVHGFIVRTSGSDSWFVARKKTRENLHNHEHPLHASIWDNIAIALPHSWKEDKQVAGLHNGTPNFHFEREREANPFPYQRHPATCPHVACMSGQYWKRYVAVWPMFLYQGVRIIVVLLFVQASGF